MIRYLLGYSLDVFLLSFPLLRMGRIKGDMECA